jgi:uncharacterized protein YdeI (YjbR/CyaY-like superfamily)
MLLKYSVISYLAFCRDWTLYGIRIKQSKELQDRTMPKSEVIYFATPAEFRDWLEENHAKAAEQWVGFYKKDAAQTGITWKEAVDEALCYGWIDGIRKSVDDQRYKIRFTPRKPGSIWSVVNLNRLDELTQLGRMQPAGLKAFQERDQKKAAQYSYEQDDIKLDPAYEKQLKANRATWEFLQAQPTSYQRAVLWWIISAKKEETRQKRLATLIDESARGQKIAAFVRGGKLLP